MPEVLAAFLDLAAQALLKTPSPTRKADTGIAAPDPAPWRHVGDAGDGRSHQAPWVHPTCVNYQGDGLFAQPARATASISLCCAILAITGSP